MNRYPTEIPYEFSPPKYSAFWAPAIYALSDALYLRRRHKVCDVQIMSGGEAVLEMVRNHDSLLIAPNHSDHSDPHTLMNLVRRYDVPVHFIATREIFLHNWGLNGRILQRAGVFSIDRDGADVKAIKEAMRVVIDGEFPLVMFPEGEIYHLNEKLTPLNDGAAAIMLKAAKRIRKEKPDKRAAIVPTAIRYTYVDDISPTFPEAMDRLEAWLHWEPKHGVDIVERIYQFGEGLLALKEQEYLGRHLEGSLTERLEEFRETLVAEAEDVFFGKVSTGEHPERVRRLKGRIRAILLADEPPDDDTTRECYKHLDRTYFAVQLYSYPGLYLREKPSMDRIAETILKFEEDVFQETEPKGNRRAEVTFCTPIMATDLLDDYAADAKGTVRTVTEQMSNAIQSVLER